MMAIHASDNPLLPRAPQSQPAPSSGASAFGPAPSVAVAGTLDGGPDHADGSTHPPTSADGACADDAPTTSSPGPTPSVSLAAAASAGTGLAATAAAAAFVNESAENVVSRERNDGVARGRIAGPRPPAGAIRNVFATSVAARIRGYYDALPEASLSTPAVSPLFAQGSSRFRGPVLRAILKFSMGAGGTGLSRQDQMQFPSLLHVVEGGAQGTDRADFSREFETASAFVTAVRGEQNRIIANLKWMQVPIEVGGKTYIFYYRDLLDAGVTAVRSATTLDLDGGPLPPADDGSPRRSSTLDADMFLQEVQTVIRLHGQRARPLFVSLHADSAVLSWSGAAYVYPLRAQFPSVRDEVSRWVTVGYIPHVEKAVSRTDKAKLAVSDCRNDLLQRCLAVVLRRFARASETGYPVDVPDIGTVLLVARVGGIVVDYLEERSLYALKGTGSKMICTQCRVRSAVCCAPHVPAADPRNVVETLEAQLAAAERRVVDPRVSLRGPLAKAHSALAFVPALGAMHGLSTGNMNFFNVVSFDLLHVWKLGVLRTLAQRIPGFLKAICTAKEGAVMGTVEHTLATLNLRAFELGRRCRVKPAAPGCFVPPKEKQATMMGRSWRHFSVFWPHIVAGLIGPADPERLVMRTRAVGQDVAAGESASDSDDGMGLDSEDEDAHQPVPSGVTIGEGTQYHATFGDMVVEDAVQDMFCRVAKLGGMFCGDNVADTVHTSGTEVAAMVEAAHEVGRRAQVLLGPVHTIKLHRIMRHLRAEFEGRGNLWEGDTSANESLHKVCKKMYLRSNKRGPTLALQMMRGEQAQTEILRGLPADDSDDDEGTDDEERAEERNAIELAHAEDVTSVPPAILSMSTRGVRVAVGDLSALPGLQDLPYLLEMDAAESVSVAKTLKYYARFEWGAATRQQYLRATPSFNGKPWYDHVRYHGDNGEVRWGEARLVLRRVGRSRAGCAVVVRRMSVVAPEPGCVLTSHGCQRLGWHFNTPDATWPTVEVVDVGRLRRLENIVPDWGDLADRHGLDVRPSKKLVSAVEFRRERFFVNAFYPWTSRPAVGDH